MKKILYLILLLMSASCSPGHNEESAEHHHDHEGESQEVELTQAQMDAVGIRLGRIEQREMADMLSVSGVLEVSPKDEALAVSPLPGTIREICVVTGQQVRAGQAVAYVGSPEIDILRQQLEEARQETAAAALELERQEALAQQGAGVRKNLEAARNTLSMAQIRQQGIETRMKSYGISAGTSLLAVKAPISGTIVGIEVSIGGFADMQTPVVRIVNNSRVYCTLQVLEKDLSSVHPGLGVEMRLTNDPSVTFHGKVADITPSIDAATRAIPVRVNISAPEGATLIPGMAVSASVSSEGAMSEVLPEEAVVSSGGKSYIFVLEDEPQSHGESGHKHDEEDDHNHGGEYHFVKTEVVKGRTSLGYTAVTLLEPLPAETKVVVAGAFYLNSMSTDHGEHNH